MVSPLLWAHLPQGNRTAWRDFVGTHGLWWRCVAEKAARDGTPFRVFPITDGGGSEWLQAVQGQYEAAASALGIAPPPDLSSYDLRREEDFASWTFLVSQTAERIRIAAGVA